MKRWLSIAWFAAVAVLPVSHSAQAQRAQYEALVTKHAKANLVPEALVHRVIVRESKYKADLIGRGGTIGLMQIKLATDRSMGYTGTAAGLLDADTNMTYAVKYLAGAYHVAGGNTNRAVHYYAAGYYYAAKSKGRTARTEETGLNAFASTAGDRAQGQHAAQAVGPNVSPASDRFGAGLD